MILLYLFSENFFKNNLVIRLTYYKCGEVERREFELPPLHFNVIELQSKLHLQDIIFNGI